MNVLGLLPEAVSGTKFVVSIRMQKSPAWKTAFVNQNAEKGLDLLSQVKPGSMREAFCIRVSKWRF
jgi:hypothetical protein